MLEIKDVKAKLQNELPRGIEPLIPYEWLAEHWNDLDGVKFTIEISGGKTTHTMTFNSSASSKAMRDAIKAVIKKDNND